MVALPVMLAWEGERSGVEVGRRGKLGVVGGVEGTRGDVCVTKGPVEKTKSRSVLRGSELRGLRWRRLAMDMEDGEE
jgi:hypothetical protein